MRLVLAIAFLLAGCGPEYDVSRAYIEPLSNTPGCVTHFVARGTDSPIAVYGKIDWSKVAVACPDPRGWGWCVAPDGEDVIRYCHQLPDGSFVGCRCE